jgi:putative restriction endonuclease
MNLAEFLASFDAQPVWKANGQRAPHKALALLYAMGQLQHGNRLVRFANGEPHITSLLKRFGPPRHVQHASQPIWRLRPRTADPMAIWEVKLDTATMLPDTDNPPEAMLRREGSFGLSLAAATLFQQDREALVTAAGAIADSIVPDTLREDLLAATIGIVEVSSATASPINAGLQQHRRIRTYRSQRDTGFARRVLEAYDYRCAICSASPRLGKDRFGLEAAHIRWVQAAGPNILSNGLCLCRMHHIALDRGAITVDESHVVAVSPLVDRSDQSDQLFWKFDSKPIRRPAQGNGAPHPEFCAWHRDEVFRTGGCDEPADASTT